MSETEKHPWEQLPDEPNRWFQRFEAFRLAGVGRSILSIYLDEWRKRQEKAQKSPTKEPVSPPGSWKEVVKKFNWAARAEAWDAWETTQKEAAIEARWQAEIMRRTEVLGRMSQIGRVSIYDICEFGKDGHITGFKDGALEKYGHLIKRVTSSKGKTESIGVELHDSKSAMEWIGKHLGLVSDRSTQMNIDLSNLTDEQLNRLAAGEDLLHVLATSS